MSENKHKVIVFLLSLFLVLVIGSVVIGGYIALKNASDNSEQSDFSVAGVNDIFNIRSFGATPNDGTEDTNAIQSAVNAAVAVGGSVYVPAGIYRSGTIDIDDNITIYGDPNYVSIIEMKDNNGGPASSPQSARYLIRPKKYLTRWVYQNNQELPNYTKNVVIRDLKLVGRSANQWDGGPLPEGSSSMHGIGMIAAYNWKLERVWAEDFDGDGFYIAGRDLGPGSFYNELLDCVATKNLRNGITIIHGDYNLIRGCKVYENQQGILPGPKYSPNMYKAAEIDFEPNRVEQTVNYNVVENNELGPGPGDGFGMTRPGPQQKGNVIRNNTFKDFKRYQFATWVEEIDSNRIQGNTFIATTSDSVATHMVIGDAKNTCVIGNTFTGNTSQNGLLVRSDAVNTSFVKNTFNLSGTSDGAAIRINVDTSGTPVGTQFFQNSGTLRIIGNGTSAQSQTQPANCPDVYTVPDAGNIGDTSTPPTEDPPAEDPVTPEDPVVEDPVDPPPATTVPQAPYNNASAFQLPGKIEAEDYDVGGEGVSYSDKTTGNDWSAYRSDGVDIISNTPASNQNMVILFQRTEWIEYTVTSTATTTYDFKAKLGTVGTSSGKLKVYVNDQIAGTLDVPQMTNWRQVVLANPISLQLPAGQSVIRLEADASNFIDLDYIEFTTKTTTSNPEAALQCKADINKDNSVNLQDFALFAASWNKNLADCSKDISGEDCKYNLQDFAIFASAYGKQGVCN